MEKFFNIAGPCNPAKHYMLPATARLPEVMRLVAREQYFAIHAARQSGKTTLLKGLVRDINASGERIALYFTVESVQAYPDPHDGIFKIVERMRSDLLSHPLFGDLVRDPSSPVPKLLPQPPDLGVKLFLTMLAKRPASRSSSSLTRWMVSPRVLWLRSFANYAMATSRATTYRFLRPWPLSA